MYLFTSQFIYLMICLFVIVVLLNLLVYLKKKKILNCHTSLLIPVFNLFIDLFVC